MSRLGQHIMPHDTGQIMRLQQPFKLFKRHEDWQDMRVMDSKVYEIGATFTSRAVIGPLDMRTALDIHVTRAKRAILNEVFGEFMEPLYHAQLHIHKGEFDKATDLIESVLTSMKT